MGCIYNRGTKSKPRYYIKWKEAGAWRVKKIGPDRSVAEAVLKKVEADVVLGRVGLLDESAPTAPIFDDAMMAWAERRRETHRSGFYDWCRAKNHFKGAFERKRVTEITVTDLVRYFNRKLQDGLAAATVGLHRRQLSRFFNDLIEDGVLKDSPLQGLSRATKRRTTSTHDPRQVPFLRHADVRAVFLELPEIAPLTPYRVMFAVGALGGLRPGEIFALDLNRPG